MRTNTTTWQRAVTQARKLQPETKQKSDSPFFDVASTSMLDAWHYVTLGPNKANVLLDSKCDCGQAKYGCTHRAAALLQMVSNLEARLWNGCDYITEQEDLKKDTQEVLDLWLALLDRYELGVDLIRAIEAGKDVQSFTGNPKKTDPALSIEQNLLYLSA